MWLGTGSSELLTKWTTFQEKDGRSTQCPLPKDKQKESNIHIINNAEFTAKKHLTTLKGGECILYWQIVETNENIRTVNLCALNIALNVQGQKG